MSVLSERVYIMEYKQRIKDKEQEQRQKQIEKLERKKELEKEKKDYEKGLFLSAKKELKNTFINKFELEGLDAKYYFWDIENRQKTINDILILFSDNKEVLGDYLEEHYNKILKDVIKNFELSSEAYQQKMDKIINEELKTKSLDEVVDKYGTPEQIENLKQARKKKKQKTIMAIFQVLGIVLKWIFYIVFGIIILFFKLINDLSKGK